MTIFESESAEETLHLVEATSGQAAAILLVLALPLAGFLLTGVLGRRMGRRPWIIAITAILVATGIATVLALTALAGEEPVRYGFSLYTWIPAGELQVQFGFLYDNLTAVMLIVVTAVGSLVHIYSIGYMAHDTGRWRFFAYLNLFMFSMLLLVLADSYVVVFAAWELVGLSSYLLIGFWYERRAPALASKKAFLVNRVADHGFLIGIMGVFLLTGTMNVLDSFAPFETADPLARDVVTLLLFIGAAGKSAQFPFHVWLPDAMEGPTPVSALIHAATMVNAGVYFVARTSPLFASAPGVLVLVAAIGTFTAILAASIALTQRDIKRVLAYSTLSQLGYMFAALGVGAFVAAIFHLMAHGFTKGLLFLGSGSVIHAVHGEQDMNRMGALWRRIPVTHWTFLIAALSLAGIPPLAGFFSKDAILGESFILGFGWVFLIGLIVAGLTGFYMFRLMGKTFYGESHVDPTVEPRVHESPRSMTVPLLLLAVPTILLGLLIGTPLGDATIVAWLEPVFHEADEILGVALPEYELMGIDGALIIVSVAVAALGIGVGIWLFGIFNGRARHETVESFTQRNRLTRALYTASLNKWWFDDLNHLLFYRFGGAVAGAVMWFDVRVIDGIVNGTGSVTQSVGDGVRHIQTGRVQNYALGIAVGLVVMAALFILLGALMVDIGQLDILSLVIFAPLIGGLVIAFVPGARVREIRYAALLAAGATLALSLLLALAFDGGEQGFQFVQQADWIGFFGISYTVGVDGISLALVLLTTLLTFISILASFGPIQTRVKEYMIAFLVLEVGMLGVFLALDLFLFYVFWEVVLVPMYLIIGIWGGSNRVYATIKFVIYTLVGSLLMLIAILALAWSYFQATGTWDGAFNYERLLLFDIDPTLQTWAFLGFFLAFAIKVPMWPFHTWLPDAHTEAPTAGSVILAGVLLKLGAYGLIRFNLPLFPEASADLAGLVIALSVVGMLYGAIVAIRQPDLKRLIAYSSVSHMGFVTLGIFVFNEQGLQGAIFQMVAHGVITGALFLLVGVIYERTHDRTIARMGGLGGPVPVFATLLVFFSLASAGLPGLAGFVGEFLVLLGAVDYQALLGYVAGFTIIFAAVYLLFMVQNTIFGKLSDFLKGLGSRLTDVDRVEAATLAPLVVLTVALGLFPALLLDLITLPVADILGSVEAAADTATVTASGPRP